MKLIQIKVEQKVYDEIKEKAEKNSLTVTRYLVLKALNKLKED